MKIEKAIEGKNAKLKIFERIDAVTSVDLQEAIESVIIDKSIVELVLDFDNLEYISSAGLRVLLNTQKIIQVDNHTMRIINVNDEVMSVFKITGFDEILNISKK